MEINVNKAPPRQSRPIAVLVIIAIFIGAVLLYNNPQYQPKTLPSAFLQPSTSTKGKLSNIVSSNGAGKSSAILSDLCSSDADDSSVSDDSDKRPAYGTNVRMPPVAYEEMPTEGKTPHASLCANDARPLHVAIVLSPLTVNSAEHIDPLELPTLKSQIDLLLHEEAGILVNNLLVTIMVELLPVADSSSLPTKSLAMATLHFSSSRGVATLLGVALVEVDKTVSVWPRTMDRIFEFLIQNKQQVGAKIIHMLQVSQAGAPRLPHVVLPLPSNTSVTSANLRGICHLDTVINDESEATAVYPFAEPFVPVGRKNERNGRMTVGLIRAVGEQITVVSSCRPPVELTPQQRMIEGGHYSKGGDMAIRGSLWSMDLGSAIERAGKPSSTIPKRSVIVPFMAGVHSDIILATPSNTKGLLPPLNNGQRMAIFPLRRPIIDSHCSSDPKNPVRVSTHMVQYVNDNLKNMRNGFDVFVRVLNATALMTGFSDLTITTNLPADLLLKYLRADVRELPPATFVTNPELDDSSKGTRFLDKSYPNPLGELVIVTSRRKTAGGWYGLAGQTHFPLLSQLGFFDIVQYTEDDVYLSRDQFAHYCATLPFLEAREEFLNQIRWETVWDEIDEGTPRPAVRQHDGYMWRRPQISVLQSKIPKLVAIPDKRPQEGWSWRTDEHKVGYSIDVKIKGGQAPDDRTRNTFAFPVPLAPAEYEVAKIPTKNCRFLGTASTHLRNNTEAHVAGCYTMAYAYHSGWGKNRIYNSMWTLPTHRVQNYYLEGIQSKHKEAGTESDIGGAYWRGNYKFFNESSPRLPFNRDSIHAFFRESILYFDSTPLLSYDVGGVYMVYMEEGEGLGAFKNREAGGSEADKPQGRYGLHRFSGINHGRNQYPNMDGAKVDEILIQPLFSIDGVHGRKTSEDKPRVENYKVGDIERTRYVYD